MDRRSCPTLAANRPILTRYADNGNFTRWGAIDGAEVVLHMAAESDECGLAFRVDQESADNGANIGLVVRVGGGTIHDTPARVLRLRRALQEL